MGYVVDEPKTLEERNQEQRIYNLLQLKSDTFSATMKSHQSAEVFAAQVELMKAFDAFIEAERHSLDA